jgi:hypothetical protein
LTASYSGFVNGDTAASLTTPPSLTTSATSASPLGTYPIAAAGASSNNYTITYGSGTLTITQASTTTTLSVTSGLTVVGQVATVTAQVAPVSPGAGNPTGTVTFLVDGSSFRTEPVDVATGKASFKTALIPFGIHTLTAIYSGDANFLSSQTTVGQQQIVSPAGTKSIVTVKAVRNRRGQLIAVDLDSQVLVVAPGIGVPTGTVTYFFGGRAFKTRSLSNGTAVLSVQPIRALGQFLFIRYNGDGNFQPSASTSQVIRLRTSKASARPLTAFFARGR